MFHLELFSSSIASGANTFAQVNYVSADAIVPKLNNGLQVPADLPFLMAVLGVSANLVHIRAQAPSMLPLPYPTLSPNNRGTAFESPPRGWDYSRAPFPLRPTEELDIFATQNAGAAQTPNIAVLLTDNKPVPAPVPATAVQLNGNSRFFTAHATGSTTLTANAFTSVPLTFDQGLPAGFYALVGARAFSATALFFRMFPARAPLWRPGGVAVQAYDQMDLFGQRYVPDYGPITGGWGVWLTFYQNVPPQVEFYATAADVAEEVWLDLIKLSDDINMPGIH